MSLSTPPTRAPHPMRPRRRRWGRVRVWDAAALLLIAAFGVLRFVRIDADFPPGLTTSGALYTDEGWYASAAQNTLLWGRWYLPGDFNPGVNMPLGQLLHAAAFRLLGMGLGSARASAALCSVLIVAAVWLLCRRALRRPWAAALCAVLLATDPFVFAHARFAVMETPMTAFAAVALLPPLLNRRRSPHAAAALSGVLLAAAVLTKSSALFALPAVAYLSAARAAGLQGGRRLLPAAVAGGVCLGLVGTYFAWAARAHPADLVYFKHINLEERAVESPLQLAYAVKAAALVTWDRGPLLFGSALLASAVAALVSARFRRSPLVHAMALWAVFCLLLLGSIRYHPSRYSLPLFVPAAVLLATAADCLWPRVRPRWLRPAVPAVPALLAAMGAALCVGYVARPTYRFVGMARDVGRIVRQGGGGPLIGGMAQSVALETGTPALNTDFGIRDLAWRVREYRPRFYITNGNDPSRDDLEREVRLVEVGRWEVFDNFYTKVPVTLYRIEYPEGRAE